jgi:hypothetical protein
MALYAYFDNYGVSSSGTFGVGNVEFLPNGDLLSIKE